MKTTYVLFILIVVFTAGCGNSKKQSLAESVIAPAKNLSDSIQQKSAVIEDTTIYVLPAITAILPNNKSYFRTHNKFKNWDKKNKKEVWVHAIIEKDGKPTILEISSCGIKELDDEAIRLIQTAKITPGSNESGEPVRNDWMIPVFFPPR